MIKIISAIPLLLSLMLACDGFNGIYNERWTDRVVPVFKTGAGLISGYTLEAGEDGHGNMQWGARWFSQRFIYNGDNTITDNNTGLMWDINANRGPGHYADAHNIISNLNSANDGAGTNGYNDWRLPNVRELASLVNYGVTAPDTPDDWLISQGFSAVQPQYWTSTSLISDPTNTAHIIIMSDGNISTLNKGASASVWALRGNSVRLLATGQTISYTSGDDGTFQKGIKSPGKRFYDNGDGTLTDRKTGLMWTKNANLTKLWLNACTYIPNSVNVGGYTDWRFSNAEELKTLINYGENSQTWLMNDQGFQNVQSVYYTSTTYAGNTAQMFFINLNTNNLTHNTKNANYVWPVRGGER